MRQKGTLKAGLIQRVNITLDRETIAWFKAQMGEDGGRRDAVAGTGRTDPPGPCPGQCRPGAPFAASEGLIPRNPQRTTPRGTPVRARGRPRTDLHRPGGRIPPQIHAEMPATSPVCRKHGAPADAGGYCRPCADEMLVRSFWPFTGGRRKKGNRQQI